MNLLLLVCSVLVDLLFVMFKGKLKYRLVFSIIGLLIIKLYFNLIFVLLMLLMVFFGLINFFVVLDILLLNIVLLYSGKYRIFVS